jgi:EAL domain-containing protein (putative c-di-GMP-specific phosphodiesterase class I)
VPGAGLRWLVVNTAPVLDDDGAVEYVVSSLRDITAEHVVTPAEQERARERSDRVAELLAAGGPAVVVQPIVELATGRTVGVEALSRFPDHDARPPDTWFADAAAAGRGQELEILAIRTALGLLDQLPDDVYLSVNASPATVTAPELLDALSGAPAHRLVLELTEHTAVTDYDALAPALNRLRWSGVRLAVDDAGSGFASMQHIVNIAPDVIKLDHALVHGVHEHPAKASLAASMVDFARRIGAELVAEGIENAHEQAALQELGVRLGQGFHLGRPAPVRALEARLSPGLPRH